MISYQELEEYFKFSFDIQVRYGDCDMFQHVNNAKYLSYLEHARIYYCREAGQWYLNDPVTVVANANMDFYKPMNMDDEPVVYIRTTRLGNKSFTLENIVADKNKEVIYLHASTVLVAFDASTQKSVGLPETFKGSILDYEKVKPGDNL